ncbi:MAG: tectonin domain-containing protein [Cyanobacteria bacterium J06634_5]
MKYIVHPVIRGSAMMPGTIPDTQIKKYVIAAAHSGKVISIRDNEVVVEQQNWTEEPRQQWKIAALSGTDSQYFCIVSVHSGSVLTVLETSSTTNQPVCIQSWNNGPGQQWSVEKLGNGRVRLLSRLSGKVLTVADRSNEQGAEVIQSLWNGDRWHRIPGQFKQISAGADGSAWGLQSDGDIFRYVGNRKWQRIKGIDGTLVQLSVGNANNVWGVSATGNIYRWTDGSWQSINGTLQQLSVGADGTVWGVNAAGEVWQYQNQPQNSRWTRVNDTLKLQQISVGSSKYIWGVDSQTNTYFWTGGQWQRVSGQMKQISVGADGTVWGVQKDNDVFRYLGNNKWEKINDALEQVSVGNVDHIWGVNSRTNTYFWGDALTLHQQWQLSTLSKPDQTFTHHSQATLYQNRDFGGESQVLGVGSYSMELLTIGDNTVSSVKVPEGLRVTLYKNNNFKGASHAFTADTPWVGDDINNQTSAILVDKVVSLYEAADYEGQHQDFGIGRYSLQDLQKGNNLASSIKVPEGYMAILYEQADYTGHFRIFLESAAWLGDDFNDITSSLVVKAIGVEIPIGSLKYGDKVVLQSHHEKYLTHTADGPPSADATAIDNPQEFTIVRAGATRYNNYVSYGDIFSLKAINNSYIAASSKGTVTTHRTDITAEERWRLLRSGDTLSHLFVTAGDIISLQSTYGRYLAAETTGRVNAESTSIDSTAKWAIRTRALAKGTHHGQEGAGTNLSICGSEACGANACGAAACGAAYSLTSACGAAAAAIAVCGADVCGAAAAVIAVCAVDACVVDAGVVAACGAEACAADIGGISACGADLCGAAACAVAACSVEGCAIDTCGADVGGVGACGAAACGGDADVIEACGADACAAEASVIDACGADACAANTCAINACLADACAADACAIDVIPIIPFI